MNRNGSSLNLDAALERLRASEVIAIIIPDVPDARIVGSAEALSTGFRALGKRTSIFAPPTLPSHALVTAPNAEEPLREFILSFDLTRSAIKELKYEKSDNRLDIILSPTGPIRREDISFRSGALRYDLAVTLGVRDLGEATQALAHVPELPHERPIVNLDDHAGNRRYGEVNLVPDTDADDSPTLPELVHLLLKELGAPEDAEIVQSLLVAVLGATKNFDPAHTRPRSLHFAATLIERGADFGVARRAFDSASSLTEAELQLAGRALARSRRDPGLATTWCLLTAEDFENVSLDATVLPAILDRIQGLFPPHDRIILLSQESRGGGVQSLIRPRGPEEREALRDRAEYQPRGSYLASPEPAHSFREAEGRIARLLDEVDAVE